jgi:hypothetical protein
MGHTAHGQSDLWTCHSVQRDGRRLERNDQATRVLLGVFGELETTEEQLTQIVPNMEPQQ